MPCPIGIVMAGRGTMMVRAGLVSGMVITMIGSHNHGMKMVVPVSGSQVRVMPGGSGQATAVEVLAMMVRSRANRGVSSMLASGKMMDVGVVMAGTSADATRGELTPQQRLVNSRKWLA